MASSHEDRLKKNKNLLEEKKKEIIDQKNRLEKLRQRDLATFRDYDDEEENRVVFELFPDVDWVDNKSEYIENFRKNFKAVIDYLEINKEKIVEVDESCDYQYDYAVILATENATKRQLQLKQKEIKHAVKMLALAEEELNDLEIIIEYLEKNNV